MVQAKNLKLHNVRVRSITRLSSPAEYWRRYPTTDAIQRQVAGHRLEIERIVDGEDERMLMIVGPCSIHDPEAGLEYARRLQTLAEVHWLSLPSNHGILSPKPREFFP